MKNNQACPKCESRHLARHPGVRQPLGGGNYIGLSPLRTSLVDRVVCLDCGFCEEWVTGRSLEQIRRANSYKPLPPIDSLKTSLGEE